MHFVQIIGTQDSVFVGPFATHDEAEAFAGKNRKGRENTADFYPMSESDMRENIAEFGEVPIYTAEEFYAD